MPPMAAPSDTDGASRQRVSAAERREALIAAAVTEFGRGGFHGTPVARIAERVGVAQPYVFSLFGSKLELFLAAVDRAFDQTAQTMETAAAAWRVGGGNESALDAMGASYRRLLESDRDNLRIQLQAYAACDDDDVRNRVRERYAELVNLVEELSGAEPERIDDFIRHGMTLNVAAALAVDELSVSSDWVRAVAPRWREGLARRRRRS